MSFRPALVLLACCAVLAACGRDTDLGPEQRADGVFRYERVMPTGQTLSLRNLVGAITIEPATDDTLRVVADLTWRGDDRQPTDVSFRADTSATGVLICAIVGNGSCSADNFTSRSSGNRITIGRRNVSLGLGGRKRSQVAFRVRIPTGAKLDLVLVEGNIVSASTAPVRARGVNGNVTVVTSVGPVQVQGVNGSVDARMTTLSGSDSVKVSTVNGNVFVFLPESADATVDMRTTNGGVLSDFPTAVGSGERFDKVIRATLGAGTTPVRVRNVNGNAQLRRLDAAGRAYELPER
jgi:hypothetical protein